jgi:type IV secretion system protein VirB5
LWIKNQSSIASHKGVAIMMTKKYIFALAFTFFCVSDAANAQIPVTVTTQVSDSPMTIAEFTENVTRWKQQYDQMVSQINQMRQQYAALTGSRGLGQIFNKSELRDYLPTDWQQIYDSVKEGGYAGLSGTAQYVYEANRVFDACASLAVVDERLACEARAVKPSQDKGFALDAYEKAKSRLEQIDQLVAQIDVTTDPKEIAELQGRIASEQAMIANEQTKLQLYAMVAKAEDRVQQQRTTELNAKANARRGWVKPTPIEFGE